MSLLYEPRIEKSSGAVFDDLARMAKRAPGGTLDRARNVAKALGMENLAPRNARGDQRVTKGAGGFYSPQFLASTDPIVADMLNPKDVSVLHDDAVNPDLRNSIIEAVKRKQRAGSYAAWNQSITPLRDAIDDLVERVGAKFSALHRLLGSKPVPTTSDDDKLEQMAGRSFAKSALSGFGKSDVGGIAQRSRDIDALMKAPMPESKRRHLIAVKNFFDIAEPHQRRALRKDTSIIALLEEMEALGLGTDATASIARLLS